MAIDIKLLEYTSLPMGHFGLGSATLGVCRSIRDFLANFDRLYTICATQFRIPISLQQLLTRNRLRLAAMAPVCLGFVLFFFLYIQKVLMFFMLFFFIAHLKQTNQPLSHACAPVMLFPRLLYSF